jgi:hypothetical protein
MQTIQRGSENFGLVLFVNNCTWEIFQYSKKKKELDTAISWIDSYLSMSSKSNPQVMDTKANLLYKLGKTNEALTLEAQSCRLAKNNKDIQRNFENMKNGLPTWISK